MDYRKVAEGIVESDAINEPASRARSARYSAGLLREWIEGESRSGCPFMACEVSCFVLWPKVGKVVHHPCGLVHIGHITRDEVTFAACALLVELVRIQIAESNREDYPDEN